jgi:WD40 repeat protein
MPAVLGDDDLVEDPPSGDNEQTQHDEALDLPDDVATGRLAPLSEDAAAAHLERSGERLSGVRAPMPSEDASTTLPRALPTPSTGVPIAPPPPPPASQPLGPPAVIVEPAGDTHRITPPPPGPPPPSSRKSAATARLPVVERDAYRILGELARGAIGRISRARDQRLGRMVALKELREEHKAEEERFVREALLTAQLEHPSIVPVHEAGRWPTGEPFYAMKLVDGRSLEVLIGEARTMDDRLRLLRHVSAVAEAMAYAHSHRVVHRDLKPSNILVGPFGETVVIDWGLAKALESEASNPEHTPTFAGTRSVEVGGDKLTQLGEVMGTPAYMPPEQARGHGVDERADVYALGAILYHLLTGVPPFEGRPHDVVLRVAREMPVPLERRQPLVPPELAAIVKKAMARDVRERYRTARQLAEDLRSFEAGHMVGAHQYGVRDQVSRFVRRYQAPLTVAAIAAVLLAVGGSFAAGRVLRERQVAETNRHEAELAQHEAASRADELSLTQARAALDRDPNESIGWLKQLGPTFDRWSEARLIAADAKARGIARVLRGHASTIQGGAFTRDGSLLVTAGSDRTARAWSMRGGAAPRTLSGHAGEVWSVATAPGGVIATGSQDGAIRLFGPAGEPQILAGHKAGVRRLVFGPDGSVLASRARDEFVRVWDVTSKTSVVPWEMASPDADLALSPDGRMLAFHAGGKLVLWDVPRRSARTLAAPGAPARASAFSSDGMWLLVGRQDGAVWLWDVARGAARPLPSHTGAVLDVAFTPDARFALTVGTDRTLHVWDAARGATRVLAGHQGDVMTVAASPDSLSAVTASADHTVRLWDLATGASDVLRGFDDVVAGAAFSPDGGAVAAWSWDHTVRTWSLADRGGRTLGLHDGQVTRVAFTADGSKVVSAGEDRTVRIYPIRGGAPTILRGHSGAVLDLAVTRDWIASASSDGTVRLASPSGVERLVLRGHSGPVNVLAASPDGTRLATAGQDRGVHVWDPTTGQRLLAFEHDGEVRALAFSPDGKLLASGGADRTVRVWPMGAGTPRTLTGHTADVLSLAFSADGARLYSGSADHSIALWDVGSGRARFVDASGGDVERLALLPGGAFASLGAEPAVRLWDGTTGEERGALRGHVGGVTALALSGDGRACVTGSLDRSVRLWDLVTRQSRVLFVHDDAVLTVALSPDGRSMASAGRDRGVRLSTDPLPVEPAELRAWLDAQDVGAPR